MIKYRRYQCDGEICSPPAMLVEKADVAMGLEIYFCDVDENTLPDGWLYYPQGNSRKARLRCPRCVEAYDKTNNK